MLQLRIIHMSFSKKKKKTVPLLYQDNFWPSFYFRFHWQWVNLKRVVENCKLLFFNQERVRAFLKRGETFNNIIRSRCFTKKTHSSL